MADGFIWAPQLLLTSNVMILKNTFVLDGTLWLGHCAGHRHLRLQLQQLPDSLSGPGEPERCGQSQLLIPGD